MTELEVVKIKAHSLENELNQMTSDKDYFVNKSKWLAIALTKKEIKISKLIRENHNLKDKIVVLYIVSLLFISLTCAIVW